jgi:hypothetical protein
LFLWGDDASNDSVDNFNEKDYCVGSGSLQTYPSISRIMFQNGFCRKFLLDETVIVFSDTHFGLIFNTFVFMQMFNLIASRKCYNELNFFENIHKNFMFVLIWLIIVALQLIVMLVPGVEKVFSVIRLTGALWGYSMAFSFFIIPFKFCLHLCIRFGDPFHGDVPIPDDKGVPAGIYKGLFNIILYFFFFFVYIFSKFSSS